MSRITKKQLRIDLRKNLKDYKGFGKRKNGMLRKGFTRLANGKIVSNNDLERAIRG